MASIVTVQVRQRPLRHGDTPRDVEATVARALNEFHRMERDCSRFDPASALSRINRRPGRWHRAPERLYTAIDLARQAHLETSGLFDPRVLDRLIALGYDRSFHLIHPDGVADRGYGDHPGDRDGPHANGLGVSTPERQPWTPRLLPGLRFVHLAGARIDLGGIGKSVALRRAASVLRRSINDFLIDAGGDLVASGRPAAGVRWRFAVESPMGGDLPVAVLEVGDAAVATSSIRVRSWVSDGRPVHHLVDPGTGEPGGCGLSAVTVVHPDPVHAEVWAKSLFLTGAGLIADRAAELGLAALWVDSEGSVGLTRAMDTQTIWVRR
jgi:FAD:protein FMN transferase